MTEARQELIRDLKFWACSPQVPMKVQLLILEAIGALSSSEYVGERAAVLREAAKIARDSYPKESEYDVLMKIAAGSIAGTLERMADAVSPSNISGERS